MKKNNNTFWKIILASFLLISIPSCNATENTKNKLSVGMTWHWQLSEKVNTNVDANLYDIDLFDSSSTLISQLKSSGKAVICYFSAGSYEDWRSDKNDFEPEDLGKPMDGWEGERWLDIRRNNVKKIMQKRLDLAKQKGCDGVEPDNIDGFDNSTELDLSATDQLKYNRFLAKAAHQRGLLIGLKNDVGQVADLVDSFDFSINEQCHEYNECNELSPFIKQGKPVFNAEYKKTYIDNNTSREALCEDAKALKIQTLVLPLDLDNSFRIACK